MSRARCTVCRKSSPDGTAGVYSAGYYESGLRIAHKNFMCPECIHERLMPLLAATAIDREIENNRACVICGDDTTDDPYYLYFTVFPPAGQRSDHEACLCLKCHAEASMWIGDCGQRLPNREPIPSTRVRTQEAWAFLAG